MMRNYNEQAFVPEEVKNGAVQRLVDYLVKENDKKDKGWFDIHITSDGYCTIVEWVDFYSEYSTSKFAFVDEDEEVVRILRYPDGVYEYVPREEVDEKMNEWINSHPNWEQNSYGVWYEVEPDFPTDDDYDVTCSEEEDNFEDNFPVADKETLCTSVVGEKIGKFRINQITKVDKEQLAQGIDFTKTLHQIDPIEGLAIEQECDDKGHYIVVAFVKPDKDEDMDGEVELKTVGNRLLNIDGRDWSDFRNLALQAIDYVSLLRQNIDE